MVEETVGNVTSFLRRWVMGALEHQHAPLAQDEDEGRPYRFSGGGATQESPWWPSWSSSSQPPPGYGNYAPTLQDGDNEMGRDEQYSMDEAMRRSRDENRRGGGDGDWRDEGDWRDDERRRERGERGGRGERHRREETDEEREQRELEIALEVSRKEAEEKARKEAEAAAAAAAAAPDLINLEADLLGLGEGAASSSGGAAAGNQLVAYDPTANDAAIARALNLLDMDSGPSDSDLLSKIESSKPGAPPSDADLLGLVDGPAPTAGGLTGQSGALVAINPNRLPTRPSPMMQGMCGGCSRKIDHGRMLNCLGRAWHPQCFKCAGCSTVISEQVFKVHEGAAYHDACYKQRFHPKCTVCNDYITPDAAGMIHYRTVPFWGDKSCHAHATDGTLQCASCHRYESRGTPFVALEDGRQLCLECLDSVVVDSNDCLPLFVAVQEFFRGLGMPVAQEIPLLCVELQALNEAAAAESKHGHAGHSVTRGLCLSEEHTVRAVVRLPGAAGRLPFGGLGQRVETLSRHSEVTAILVLYGLPRLLTGEILAHELMHAWFRLDGRFPPLSSDVEEGLCQVLAHLWLQAQLGAMEAGPAPGPGTPEAFQKRFAEFCMHSIAMDTSPVYGEGFRRAYAATVQHGLLGTLEVVRQTGQLPR